MDAELRKQRRASTAALRQKYQLLYPHVRSALEMLDDTQRFVWELLMTKSRIYVGLRCLKSEPSVYLPPSFELVKCSTKDVKP